MVSQRSKHFLFSVALLCVLLAVVAVLSVILSSEQVVQAWGTDPSGERGSMPRGTTPASLTTRSVFLPFVGKNRGVTTYAAFLLDLPAGAQVMGTGGLLGFGMMLGLFLLSDKPGLKSDRTKKQ